MLNEPKQPDLGQLYVHEQLGRPWRRDGNSSTSSPTLTDCTFDGQLGLRRGGGMYNNSSSPTLTNCTFTSNSADFGGGGMYNDHQQARP